MPDEPNLSSSATATIGVRELATIDVTWEPSDTPEYHLRVGNISAMVAWRLPRHGHPAGHQGSAAARWWWTTPWRAVDSRFELHLAAPITSAAPSCLTAITLGLSHDLLHILRIGPTRPLQPGCTSGAERLRRPERL
jgi:hypothetical protein